ncbi:glycosyltransferase [Clostridium sporogenes]|uniref:glycosyltransferase n=1 Tax=Clostridium sporogenes TaxID=1509 RepID=UPI002237E86E|nr:glycosyltransferase [Clostridium sporogenes]MCW6062724.1 glycosyltransferase [Clostridium sporogenes]
MKICILTSGHDVYDNRIYYKEILSLKKIYKEIYLIAPGEKDFVTKDGIVVKAFRKRKAWYDRIRPMRDMYKIAKEINADVYHAHEPDSFQMAVKLKKELKCKIIYDSHEYHPEAFAEHFSICKNIITKAIYLYEKKLALNADYIISVNDILINKFKSYNPNVALIPNYPVFNEGEFLKEYNKKPTFIYVGGIREDRGILEILSAIGQVNSDCKYYFIGPYENKEIENNINKVLKDELKEKDIIFTGKIPHLEVFSYLKKSHVGFVLLQSTNWRYVNSEPIKLFEYMITKNAIIASNFPMMRNIINKWNNGILVNPSSPKEIAMAIDKMAGNIQLTKSMADKGFEGVLNRYNWSVCEEKLFHIYKDIKSN